LEGAVRIVILDDYQRAALRSADWSTVDADVVTVNHHVDDHDDLVAILAGAEVVVAMRERTPFPARLLDRLPALRLLVTTAMYNASIDLAAAAARGITVCGTRGVKQSTAELTWGLILALVRDIPGEQQSLRAGGWQVGLGASLHGKTLGLIGLGTVGGHMARVGNAFDMDVVAWSSNLTRERAAECGARLVGKEELLRTADVVSIHLVLGQRNRNLVGAPELALMRAESYLVNTSRGPIVDTDALVAALHAGAIAGAALDVFDVEPLPAEHPLRGTPNTILTPHIGYVTAEDYRLFYGDAVADIAAWRAGSPIRVLADPTRVAAR
jgi:phosphoglycerate dehydrogenase-like enzyme